MLKKYADTNPSFVASMAAVAAAVLSAVKLALFFYSGSLLVAISALDSCLDLVVSGTNRFILSLSRSGADDNHPYGHGRAESLAALGQGALLAGGTLVVMVSSLKNIVRLWRATSEQRALEVLDHLPLYVLFFLVCAGISAVVAAWLKYYSQKFQSPALQADAVHYYIDFLTNIGSACGFCLMMFFHQAIFDPVCAFLFSLFILRGAYDLISTAVHDLMDSDLPEDIKKHVQTVILNVDIRIIDIHKFRGRKSGGEYFFEFHITLPTSLPFVTVHEIVENVESALAQHYEGGVIVHADPLGADAYFYTPDAKRDGIS